MRLIHKPIIIAICGKSATGKDTIARALAAYLIKIGYNVNLMVSDTTRPCRTGEINGINYNFISEAKFRNNIKANKYLEYAFFNNWIYGTNKDSISETAVNIGVFNAEGIKSLSKLNDLYHITCIYLECPFYERLKRSIKREDDIKLEFFRRGIVDYYDFRNIDRILYRFPWQLILDTQNKSVDRMISYIARKLKIK